MKKWKCTVCGYVHEAPKPPDACPVCGALNLRFILLEPLPPELEKSLKLAFAAESKAHVRNLAFSQRAEVEGYPQVARLFRAVAESERIHAVESLRYLEGVIGSTEENLKAAFESEIKAAAEGYGPMIKEAVAGRREDVTWSFSRTRDVEARHAKLYKDALAALTSDREIEYHVCQVCGYVFDGPLPNQCPICRAGRENFDRIN
ncbi:MAG: rubredoxin-like domain-containing protein [Thermodesulfobacteriota bacterium]